MSTNAKAAIAGVIVLSALFTFYVIALNQISGVSNQPSASATATPVPTSDPLVGRWVAKDWAEGTNTWTDRVSGLTATAPTNANRPNIDDTDRSPDGERTGLTFDGVNDFLVIAPNDNPLNGARRMTAVALFRATGGASGPDDPTRWWNQPGLLHGDTPGLANDWGLTYNADGDATAFFGAPIPVTPPVNLLDEQWHTMAMTWESPAVGGDGVARLFIDGNPAGSITAPADGRGITNQNGLAIGTDAESVLLCCAQAATNRYFSGAIGELRLYTSVEDPAQIHADLLGGAAITDTTVEIVPGPTVTVRGEVFPVGNQTSVRFRFSTDPEMDTPDTTDPETVSADSPMVLRAGLTDLEPDTRYYFRIEAENQHGLFVGRTHSFIVGPELRVEQPSGAILLDGKADIRFLAAPGTSTPPKTFTLTNTGNLDLTNLSIDITGAEADEFTLNPPNVTVLEPGEMTSFTVVFTPRTPGEFVATFGIAQGASDNQSRFEAVLFGDGATIWHGPTTTFTNTCAECEIDELTDNVAITRANKGGIFNSIDETGPTGKDGASPIDTEWAFGTTAQLGDLEFKPWFEWLGFKSPGRVIDQPAVLHLITDDIYIDIQFTSWQDGGGGGFSYTRTTPDQ